MMCEKCKARLPKKAIRTHCNKGHEVTAASTLADGRCKECNNARQRKYRLKEKR